MRIAERALALSPSATLTLAVELKRRQRLGQDVVNFLEGEPGLPVPQRVLAATAAALRQGRTRYSESSGLPELRAAIARRLRRSGVAAGPENVVVGNGAKQMIYETLQALCGPGDEVLIPSPYWVTLPEAARLAGATPVFVKTRPDHQLDLEALSRAVTRKTRAIILNSPNNPTGAVYGKADLRRVGELAVRKGLWIVSDEAYGSFVYDGARHVSMASLSPAIAARTVTAQTFSKTYSMTGFRIGYVAAPKPVAAAIAGIHGHVTGNACTFAQVGALAALETTDAELEKRRAVFERRRDLACALAMPLLDFVEPRGAFYLFCDARKLLSRKVPDSAALARRLLERARVAVVPGSAFGAEGYIRLCFAGPEAETREGFGRLAAAIS
jgi:aspartate aminotransferase